MVSGVTGYYIRDSLQEDKDKFVSAVYDTARISVYYDILKKYDEGKQSEAINTLRSWLDTDVKVVKGYLPKLNEKEQERIKRLLAVVEAERKNSNNANQH